VGYIFGRIGIKNIPEYLKDELTNSISEVRVGKEFTRALEEFDYKIRDINHQED
jgi:hypothetical protein